MPHIPDLDQLLRAAVGSVGGSERPGQVQMAHAVERAVEREEHLLVQAGTGTGKSLAYLVPAVAHAFRTGKPAVVATATLALQAQIVDRDLPRIADALTPLLGRRPTFALVKGRANYLCEHKLVGGFPDEDEDALLAMGQVDRERSRLGDEVMRLREWADLTESGDRDELVPGVSNRAWRQVSVTAQECLGSRCPVVAECFVERSREAAQEVDVIVTNHSFAAIDAFEGRRMLPEHDLLIVDEAHELTDRVTSTVTDELTAGIVATAARKAGRGEAAARLAENADVLAAALEELPEGKLARLPERLVLALQVVRDAAREALSELKPEKGQEIDGARQVALAAVEEVHDTAARLLEERELDVAWLSQEQRRGAVLRVAPMSVAMKLREHVFSERTVVMTSATLELGGTFDAVAGTLGLKGPGAPPWEGLDVGSPFDYPQQAIAYVASHLPAPGRDGAATVVLDEIESLVRAAGGRTLGLFSSRRAAETAAEEMRNRLSDTDITVLCQGEDQLPTLVRSFASDARVCLFGTLSLWQGVDVPGSSCQLVIIDRIPFPRPDDPLASARTEAIGRMGGNGFMAVSATHAALLLAQGAGRLVRRSTDRGVVAFLDSRMITARYAGFLQRSLPPFWPTTDKTLVIGALERLDATAPEVVPVAELRTRTLTGEASTGPRKKVSSTGAPEAAETPSASSPASGGEVGRPEEALTEADLLTGAPADAEHHPDLRAEVAHPVPVARSPRTAVTGGHAWTEDQDAELREGLEAGVEVEELAEHLELAPDLVVARMNQLGLEPEEIG